MGLNFNDSVRRNNPVWNTNTHAFQVTIGATTTIDLSSPAAVAAGGVGEANKLRPGYIMICHQSGGPLSVQNGESVTAFPNHGITLMPGATFEFAVGAMTNPLTAAADINTILIKGAGGDVFSVFYFA
tara:strand:- start:350 stop:733 length:384 start_codon:yes stop_codon:yes gene_type:complete